MAFKKITIFAWILILCSADHSKSGEVSSALSPSFEMQIRGSFPSEVLEKYGHNFIVNGAFNGPLLLKLLNDENTDVQRRALDVLVSCHSLRANVDRKHWSSIRLRAIELMSSENDELLKTALLSAPSFFEDDRDGKLSAALMSNLDNNDDYVVTFALQGLRSVQSFVLHSDKAISALKQIAMANKHPIAQREAIKFLFELVDVLRPKG